MAQHDYNISNQSGAAFRADLNNALSAIVSNNSGAVEPSTTYAYQFWADTTAGVLKQRNAANSAWVTLFQLDGEWSTIALENGTGAAPSLYFKDSGTDTGLYSPGVDQLGVATAGVQRVNFNGATEVVFNDTGADVDFRIEGDTEPNLFVIDAGTDQVRVKNLNGGPLAGTRNRIINGDMRIDQRNAGASVNTNGSYPVDRFRQDFAGGGVITAQRSTTAPAGFTNSVSLTVSTADSSIAAGDYYLLQHRIEGFNTADFGFGAAGAATVTMSFWARSSVTGTYGAALHNDNDTRAYVFTYTINAVNTWEYKTITIAGDTTGTWSTGNTTGISIIFDFGSGTNFNGTAGTWAGSNVFRTSGCVNWIANSGATFYITGVQLEPGTVATLFERIDYSESLRRCQRYYQVLGPSDTLTTGTTICVMPQASTGAVNENWGMTEFKVSMRAGPTVSASSWELAGHHGNTPIIAAGTKYALFRYDGSNFRGSGGRLIANNAQASAEL